MKRSSMVALSPRHRPRRRLDRSTVVALGMLLLLPGYALSRLSPAVNGWVVVTLAFAVSVYAFFAYRRDKRSAEAGEWRISESALHLLSLVGGWPGAFLAQRMFRHKTSKRSFQFVFWSVVALHQFVAVDSLLEWRLTAHAVRFVRSQIV